MADETISDGSRIAQLLASELTGLELGTLSAVEVVDADPDAEPSPNGTVAYRIAHDDEQAGVVTMFPDAIHLTLSIPGEGALPDAIQELVVDSQEAGTENLTLRIESGRAVKTAVDAVEHALAGRQ
mgnify:CR=1 FL=1